MLKSKMYSYEPTPLRPIIEAVDEGERDWKRETVTIDAAYSNERLIIHLYLPTSNTPPYNAVVYFPGTAALKSLEFDLSSWLIPWDSIPKSGRVFVAPVYSGMFERGTGSAGNVFKQFTKYFSQWIKDMGRTIDYLKTRQDINTESLAYIGLSFGANLGPAISVYENRIRSLILFGAGHQYPLSKPKPKDTIPHATVPILMLNGKYDYLYPVDSHQKPLFDRLGTPQEHKRHILYDAGHIPFPRAQCIKDVLAWLDRYQEPVKSESK
jgi:dienelactone hydrolase